MRRYMVEVDGDLLVEATAHLAAAAVLLESSLPKMAETCRETAHRLDDVLRKQPTS